MSRASIPVFLSVPSPVVNGITTYSAYLARGLSKLGYAARLLITEADTTLVTYHEKTLSLPEDIKTEFLPVHRLDGWGAHWGTLIRVLEESAPCIYIPNSDFRHSVISPALSPEVKIVGVAHADELFHYDHVDRLGAYWDRIVCVSEEVATRIRATRPELAPRVQVILNGVETPPRYPQTRTFDDPLRLVYHGAFKQHQKRILEFPSILRAIRRRGVDARLTLIGSGPDEEALRREGPDLVDEGVLEIAAPMPNDELRKHLEDFHIYLLNSEFEGMPQALLEAMSRGCVPIITDVSSGVREVLHDGENGYLVPVDGSEDVIADRVALLDHDRNLLREMSGRAFEALEAAGLRIEDMAASYDHLFQKLLDPTSDTAFARTPGPIAAPPEVVGGVSLFPFSLPVEAPGLGHFETWSDVADFEANPTQVGTSDRDLAERPLFLAAKRPIGSGTTEFAVDLARAARQHGLDARLLFLQPAPRGIEAIPADLPTEILVTKKRSTPGEIEAHLRERLAREDGCSYVGLDAPAALLASSLPPNVRTAAYLNTSDVHWAREHDLMRQLDGMVFSSAMAEQAMLDGAGAPSKPIARISHPIDSLAELPARPDEFRVRTLVYLGPLAGAAVDSELAAPMAALAAELGMDVTVMVSPIQSRWSCRRAIRLFGSSRRRVVRSKNRDQLREQFSNADLLLVPAVLSDVSTVLLDAFGHGCIPISFATPQVYEQLGDELAPYFFSPDDMPLALNSTRELATSAQLLRERAEAVRAHIYEGYARCGEIGMPWRRFLARLWSATEDRK